MGYQLVKICIEIHGQCTFIAVLTTAFHLHPSWAKGTGFTQFRNTSVRSILISFFCLRLSPPFRRLLKIVKSDYWLRRVCLSVCLSVRPSVRPHGTTRLPLDGFSWNFVYFSKICSRNSIFIKIWEK